MNRRAFISLVSLATVNILVPKLPDHYRWKGRVIVPNKTLHLFWLSGQVGHFQHDDAYLNALGKTLVQWDVNNYLREYPVTWK